MAGVPHGQTRRWPRVGALTDARLQRTVLFQFPVNAGDYFLYFIFVTKIINPVTIK